MSASESLNRTLNRLERICQVVYNQDDKPVIVNDALHDAMLGIALSSRIELPEDDDELFAYVVGSARKRALTIFTRDTGGITVGRGNLPAGNLSIGDVSSSFVELDNPLLEEIVEYIESDVPTPEQEKLRKDDVCSNMAIITLFAEAVGVTPDDIFSAVELSAKTGRPGIAASLARVVGVSVRTMQNRVAKATREIGGQIK